MSITIHVRTGRGIAKANSFTDTVARIKRKPRRYKVYSKSVTFRGVSYPLLGGTHIPPFILLEKAS
jgi:hypothetical protein